MERSWIFLGIAGVIAITTYLDLLGMVFMGELIRSGLTVVAAFMLTFAGGRVLEPVKTYQG